jgi:hypothetical protein
MRIPRSVTSIRDLNDQTRTNKQFSNASIKQRAPRLKMGIFSSSGPKPTAARKTSTTSSSTTSVRALQARAFDVWNSRGSQSSQKADEAGNLDQQRAKKHVVPERFAREVIVMRN